jgi:hypothetical protein
VLPAKCYPGDQIRNNEMGGTCGTYGRRERCIQDFGGGWHLRERGRFGRSRIRLEDNIKMDLEEVGWRYELDWPVVKVMSASNTTMSSTLSIY